MDFVRETVEEGSRRRNVHAVWTWRCGSTFRSLSSEMGLTVPVLQLLKAKGEALGGNSHGNAFITVPGVCVWEGGV